MTDAFNLLPEQHRREAIRAFAIRRWSIVLLIVAACIFTYGLREWSTCEELERELLSAAPTTLTVRNNMELIKVRESRLAGITHELDQLTSLHPLPNPLPFMELIGSAAQAAGNQLFISHISISSNAPDFGSADSIRKIRTTPESANAPGVSGKRTTTTIRDTADVLSTRVNLHGKAREELTVARFVVALRESGRFSSVQLVSSEPATDGLASGRSFEVECVRRETGI